MNLLMRGAGLVRSMLIPVVISACQLNELNSPLEPEIGTGLVYALTTLNEKPVPVVITQGNSTFEVQRGALTLAADSTWLLSFVIRQQGNGTVQRTVSSQRGNYRQPAQSANLILHASATDTVAIFSGTYSSTAIQLTDVSVLQGDRMQFSRN